MSVDPIESKEDLYGDDELATIESELGYNPFEEDEEEDDDV